MLILAKYAVSAFIIVFVSELAKKSAKLGALVSSLPLITILAMIWIYAETRNSQKIGEYASYTFWYVLPTLPMFLLMPWLISRGANFWAALILGAVSAVASFALITLLAKRFGVNLL